MKRLIAIMLLAFQTRPAAATNIDVEGTSSTSSKSGYVALAGDFNPDVDRKLDNVYTWNASVNPSSSEAKDTSGVTIKDTTNEFTVGLGMSLPSHFSFDVSYGASNTPEEKLTSGGPSLTLGYLRTFGETEVKAKSSDEAKEPSQNKSVMASNGWSLGVDLTFASEDYDQKFTVDVARRPGVTRPVTGDNTISQSSTEIAFKIVPVDWFKIRLSSARYKYNKDVNAFLQFLDSHNLVNQASSGMSGALSGFYESMTTVTMYFYFLDSWEVDLRRSVSSIISDGSIATATKLTLGYDLTSAWHLILAGENTKSSLSTKADENSGTLGFTYEF